MNDTRKTLDLLRGKQDVQTYWDESGHQQVRSAGVCLTAQQQGKIVKQLNRLAVTVRHNVPGLEALIADAIANALPAGVVDHRHTFEHYLATFQ